MSDHGLGMNWESWTEQAWKVRERAHAPYSGFSVGAVVVGSEGEVFVGCNVENLSYGLTMCAERVAIGSAVAAGITEVIAAVIVADTSEPISPCGACRQVLAEFGNPQVRLIGQTGSVDFLLSELLPRAKTGILERP